MAMEKFTCSSCGNEFERESSNQECKVCHRTNCKECINDEGVCVPCQKKK